MTTIQIDDETWAMLNKMKKRGESFNDLIGKLIDDKIKREEEQNGSEPRD